MPSKHKTPLLGWHPADPMLKPWLEAEAQRRGVTVSVVLNEAVEAYRTAAGELAEPDTYNPFGQPPAGDHNP